MQRTNERKEGYPQNRDNRREEGHRDDSEPRNYRNPDPLNVNLEGKSVVIVLLTGRTESGILKAMGQYSLSLELPSKKMLIVNKAAILTVSVL
jgi:hypothetical protein